MRDLSEIFRSSSNAIRTYATQKNSKILKCLLLWNSRIESIFGKGVVSRTEMKAIPTVIVSMRRHQQSIVQDDFLDVDEFMSWLWPESRTSR